MLPKKIVLVLLPANQLSSCFSYYLGQSCLRRSYLVVSTLPEKQLSEKILVVVAKMLEYKVNLVVYHHHPEPQHLYQFN